MGTCQKVISFPFKEETGKLQMHQAIVVGTSRVWWVFVRELDLAKAKDAALPTAVVLVLVVTIIVRSSCGS